MIGIGYLLITALVWATIIALSWALSKYLKKVYENEKTFLDKMLNPVESIIYRILGIDRNKSMDWKEYFLSLFVFSVFSAAISFVVLTFQGILPLNPMKFPGMNWSLALNTAMSISSNTNLQHYNGGSTLSYLGQMVGIQFLQFTSAASGIVVAVSIFRGFAGKRDDNRNIGNFYTDMVRTMTRVLLPLTLILALLLIGLGIPQSLSGYNLVRTLSGSFELIKVGPVSSLVSIMQLGTNGGGYFGANSAYPFQNPSPLTNYIELGAMMLIPTSMPFLFGQMLHKNGEGRTILIASYGLYAIDLAIALIPITALGPGMETRFGGFSAVLYTVTTTAFTTGSVNTALAAMHPLVILAAFLGMMIQATPGGIGVGAMYMLMYVIITVFIVGLMAGRTPEYLGAKITSTDVKLAVVAFLAHPIIILVPTVIAYAIGAAHTIGLGNGPVGFTQILYEYTSAAANNGSDFLGSTGNTVFFNVSTGIVMWAGRFIPIVIMLAIAGRMSGKKRSTEIALRTDNLIFPAILIFSILILAVLTFFPFLAVGPILMHLEGIRNAL
ncbi:MAG: potassium-transporting ATPase subunit KdpA [Candidatus Thermoplasmatota archaeon]|nr:potassium-transporting ATPase subunit KdpA [Candidatus Thermoplasmatota archaeon]